MQPQSPTVTAADLGPTFKRLDAILNGLTLQALTSEAALDSVRIREEVIRTLFGEVPTAAKASAR